MSVPRSPASTAEDKRQENIKDQLAGINRTSTSNRATAANDAERTNPCLKEQRLTFKCLDDNDYDKDRCQLFFHNYNTCKIFWAYVEKDRRRKGVKPTLPLPADRERVKREYFASNIKT